KFRLYCSRKASSLPQFGQGRPVTQSGGARLSRIKTFPRLPRMRFFRRTPIPSPRKCFERHSPSARRATIAQSVEQPPCKRQVGSSILPGGSIRSQLVFGPTLLSFGG